MSEGPKHNKAEPVLKDKHLMPHAGRTLDPPIRLVDRAKEIESASESIETHVNGKLQLIVNQIRSLQEEAKQIVEQAHLDVELHKVKCNFEKAVGQEMHLYEKPDGAKYFSLLSPAEWNNKPPHNFLGSYRLQPDRSFEETLSQSDFQNLQSS